ncbi:MAG: oligosaccharide flippase family protein [Bradymonadales bacterium]|nr:oligosaccharide flippase family protein [Bradymonadales bacterium]
MSQIARTTGRGFLVITAAKVWFLLTGAFVNLSLPRFFEQQPGQGTAAFGDYGVVINLVSILNMVMITGTLQAVSKVVSETPRRAGQHVRRALAVQLGIGLPAALAYFLVAPLAARAFHDLRLSPYIRLSAAIVLFYSFYAIFVGYFNGKKEFVRQASLDIGFATLKTILIIAAVISGLGVMGAVGGFVLTALALTVVSAAWFWRREAIPRTTEQPPPQPGAEPARSRRILGYMVALMAYTFLLNLIIRVDLFCLKAVSALRFRDLGHPEPIVATLSSSLAGVYTGMANIARLPYQAVIAITFVIFPIISQSTFEGDLPATRAYIRQTLRYSLILIGSMAAVLIALRTTLVDVLYPDDYLAGSSALLWLSLGMVSFALTFVGTTILNSAGHPVWSLALVGGTLVATAAMTLLLLLQGATGDPMLSRAALATTLATTAGLAAVLWIIFRQYRAGLPLFTVLRSAAASLVVILGGRVIDQLAPVTWYVLCAILLLAAVLGVITWRWRTNRKRVAVIGSVAGLVVLVAVWFSLDLFGRPGWFNLVILLVGKMAFLGILFYALLYLLREFGAEDLRRVQSVLGSRSAPTGKAEP